MQIAWYGQFCFEIVTTPSKEKVKIIVDPLPVEISKKFAKLEGDISLITHQYLNLKENKISPTKSFLISGPGEYEIKEIFIEGIPSLQKKNTIYTIFSENLKVCHLGSLKQSELNENQLERIGEIDILMVPIGGNSTLSPRETIKIIQQLEPKIVIPMDYHLSKLKTRLSPFQEFLKILGLKEIKPKDKLNIKKKDLFEEKEREVVILKAH